jgi:hypothetical protein
LLLSRSLLSEEVHLETLGTDLEESEIVPQTEFPKVFPDECIRASKQDQLRSTHGASRLWRPLDVSGVGGQETKLTYRRRFSPPCALLFVVVFRLVLQCSKQLQKLLLLSTCHILLKGLLDNFSLRAFAAKEKGIPDEVGVDLNVGRHVQTVAQLIAQSTLFSFRLE